MSHVAKLGIIASALLLGACTFQMQAGTRANGTARNQRRAAQPARRTTNQANTPRPAATPAKPPTTPAPTNVPTITGRNAFGNGTVGAFRGVAYVIPKDTQKMPDLSKLVPFAQLMTDSFIVQPQEFTAGFPGVLMQDEWFAIRYEGKFEVARESNYKFKLNSDDGAILYIDGEKVIDNDGLHVAKDVYGSKTLTAGRHQLRLDYFQGNRGPVALSVGIGETASDADTRPLVGIR